MNWIVVTYDEGANVVAYIGTFNEKDASEYAAKIQGEKYRTGVGAKAHVLQPVPVAV